MIRKRSDPRRAVDEQILHIRGLVLIRTLLADRGATPAELAEYDDVIDRCRRELADLAGASAPVAA